MPSLFGKNSKKEELITNLAHLFNSIHKARQVPEGDFPSVKRMQELLPEYDFTKFPKLNQSLVDTVEQMLAVDISRIMKMLPKEEAVSKDSRIKGGVFGYSEADPFSDRRDLTKASTYSAYDEGWIVAQDQAKYDSVFSKLNPNPQGKITGNIKIMSMYSIYTINRDIHVYIQFIRF